MATTLKRQDDYISLARASARKVWEGILELESLQKEWNAESYGTGSNLVPLAGGANAGITSAIAGAAIFAGADGLRTALNGGLATNFANML